MNTRVHFLRWKPVHFWLVLIILAIVVVVAVGLYYNPLETIFSIVVVIVAMTMIGIINNSADDVERAKNWRNPVGPDEILSFSLEEKSEKQK